MNREPRGGNVRVVATATHHAARVSFANNEPSPMSNAPSLLQPTYDAGAMHRFSLPVYEPHPLFTQFTQGKLSRIHPDGGELWYHDFIAQQKEPHERTQHKPPCSNAQQSHHAAPPDRRTPRTSPTGQPCIRLFGGCLHATFPQQQLPCRSA